MSLSSRTTYGVGEEPNYEDMPDEKLNDVLESAISINEIVALENDVFERYLQRNDSESLIPMAQVLETAVAISSQITQISSPHCRESASVGGFSTRGRNTSVTPSTGSIRTFIGSRGAQVSVMQSSIRGFRIALSQRIGMVKKEIEEMCKEHDKHENETIKTKANLCAQLREIRMRTRDIDKVRGELEENFANRSISPSIGKISARQFICFTELWLKNADRMIDKLQLTNYTTKSRIKKAMTQSRQRKEFGENLRFIDFQALVIANEIHKKQILDKTERLVRLKKICGCYISSLRMQRDRLSEQQIILDNLDEQMKIEQIQIGTLNSHLENTHFHVCKMNECMKKTVQVYDEINKEKEN